MFENALVIAVSIADCHRRRIRSDDSTHGKITLNETSFS
jgi:hypothetical protein